MKFTLTERFQLLGILPEQGTRITGKIIMDFVRELQPSVNEYEEYGIKEEGEWYQAPDKKTPPYKVPQGQVRWDGTINHLKDIEVNDVILDIIVKSLKTLDERKTLPFSLHVLYDRFITNPEPQKKKRKR
jgi:hypothetical protein